jgi:xanthine/CO dehydrogenase XdhC/CoxF family maturation factor
VKEREHILNLWQALKTPTEQAILATVVKTLGSSYRRPGARLLLTATGHRAGSVSGGCLEEDLIRKAFWLTEKGPALRRYDTTPDGDIQPDDAPAVTTASGFGLGCNGIVHVLLERVSQAQPGLLNLLDQVHQTRRPASVAHLLAPSEFVGQHLAVNCQADASHNLSNAALLQSLLKEQSASATNRVTHLDSGHEVFFETLTPPTRLLIFGAGDDAVPLTELARQLGWQVSVFDGRSHYARSEKFPAAQLVSVRPSETPAASLQIDPWTVAVTMTHSYTQDLNNIRALAGEPLAYLGVLGPRNRTTQLLSEAGIETTLLENIHSPMGLDIGADGPEQVALSVIAEIQASLNSRNGGSLRARSGSIHSASFDGSSYKSSIVCA